MGIEFSVYSLGEAIYRLVGKLGELGKSIFATFMFGDLLGEDLLEAVTKGYHCIIILTYYVG